MILKATKNYLLQINEAQITSDLLISFFCFLELLPIYYNTLQSSFHIVNKLPPRFFKYFAYISWYNQFLSIFPNHSYPFYFLIIVLIILILYLFGKYLILQLKYFKDSLLIRKILYNVYNYFIFKFLVIIILDIEIDKMLSDNTTYQILCTLIAFFTFLAIYYSYDLNHVYISIMPMKISAFDNEILLLYDKYNLIAKTVICFITHIEYKIHTNTAMNAISYFLNFFLFAINFFSFIHQCYLIFIHRFIYISGELNVTLKLCSNISLMFMSVYICFIHNYNVFSFICLFINSAIAAFFCSFFLRKAATYKIMKNGNELGIVYYLINEVNTTNIQNLIPQIINNHKMLCNDLTCPFCKKMLNYKDRAQEIAFEKLISMLFKYRIKNQKYTASVELIDFFALFHIVELYTCYLSKKKNLIKIIMIYNKTKTLLRLSKNEVKNTKTSLFKNLSTTFLLSYELLYNEIVNRLLLNAKTNQNGHLIVIDEINVHTRVFLNTIRNFFNVGFKRPLDVIDLAHSFSHLKKKVDVDFLVSKENKFTYTCVLMGYIFEEIFTEQITRSYSINDLIFSLEELLTYHFLNDKTILILCDVVNSLFLIKQCGKDIINVKEQNFEKIFPTYLQKEGKKRLMTILSDTQANYFEYYYHHQIKHSIEKFKMKFLGIPSLDVDNAFIYIICNYKIEKDNLLIFENHYYNNTLNKVLISCSETVENFLKITHNDIEKTLEDKNYISSNDLFDSNTNIINYNSIYKCLTKKLGYQSIQFSDRILNVIFKEKVDKYEVYAIHEKKEKKVTSKKGETDEISENNNDYTDDKTDKTNSFNSKLTSSGFEDDMVSPHTIGLPTQTAITGVSSSTHTQTSISTYINNLANIKEEKTYKYRKFSRYTCYLISFNILILCVIIFFLVFELINNFNLEHLYAVITYYNTFQEFFYITALSVFSLACISDDLTQKICENSFVTFSNKLNEELNLNENQKIYDYISRELYIKSDTVISSLKQWESDKNMIQSKELEVTLSENLDFDALEENNSVISVVTIPLTFEEAIRRFVNVVTLIIASDDYLNSPVYPISSDGSGFVDMSNAMAIKNEQNTYLTDTQKYYYTMILNYQKFILRLLSIGDIVYNYFEDKVSKTSNEILIFVLLFIVLHIAMMGICIIFTIKFKEIHLDFFILVYQKLSDTSFILYYKEKIEILSNLLDFYKDKPHVLITKLNKIKQKEMVRNKKELQTRARENGHSNINDNLSMSGLAINNGMGNASTALMPSTTQYIIEQCGVDKSKLNEIYNQSIIFNYIVQIFIIFGLYMVLCIIFYVIISGNINNLSLMNKYAQGNFDISNKIYINLGLTQIMALTNQTESMLSEFFNLHLANSKATTKYISENIEATILLIIEVDQMQKLYDFFLSINELIDTNCDVVYEYFEDLFIEEMLERYPENNYLTLFKKYCHSIESLHTYEDPRLSMLIVTYQNEKLLEMFVNRELKTYADISNDDLIYTMYSQVLLLIRPFRRFITNNLTEVVINTIINNYMVVMIIFLVINFAYEMFILVMIKCRIINSIISMSKEIIVVAKAFECFL